MVKDFADHGTSTTTKRSASQRSPAKSTPQMKRQKNDNLRLQDNQPQNTIHSPSPAMENNSSSAIHVLEVCPNCKDLSPDQKCVWVIRVTRQNIKGLEGSVLTCADIQDRIPPVVSLPMTSFEATVKFDLL